MMLYSALQCLYVSVLSSQAWVFFSFLWSDKLLRDSLRPLPMFNGKTHQNEIQNKQRTGCRSYGGLLRDIAERKTACAGISFNAESSPPPPQCVKNILNSTLLTTYLQAFASWCTGLTILFNVLKK